MKYDYFYNYNTLVSQADFTQQNTHLLKKEKKKKIYIYIYINIQSCPDAIYLFIYF